MFPRSGPCRGPRLGPDLTRTTRFTQLHAIPCGRRSCGGGPKPVRRHLLIRRCQARPGAVAGNCSRDMAGTRSSCYATRPYHNFVLELLENGSAMGSNGVGNNPCPGEGGGLCLNGRRGVPCSPAAPPPHRAHGAGHEGEGREVLEGEGEGGGVWDPKFVYQKWPDRISPMVYLTFSHWSLWSGGGGVPPTVHGHSTASLRSGRASCSPPPAPAPWRVRAVLRPRHAQHAAPAHCRR